jgi:hypothetical protein
MEATTTTYFPRYAADAPTTADPEAVVVTERRPPAWTTAPRRTGVDPLAGLVAAGLVEPAKPPVPWGEERWESHAYTEAEIDRLLAFLTSGG